MKKLFFGSSALLFFVWIVNVCDVSLLLSRTSHPVIKRGVQTVMEKRVRERYKSIPILAEIAACESDFTHWSASGEIYRGERNPNDIGVMQINTSYHEDNARKLGYDIYSFRGNLDFAEYLYRRDGTRPWNPSKNCWGKKEGPLAFSR